MTPIVVPDARDLARIARARAVKSVVDLVGRTPLVRIRALARDLPKVELWAKCEWWNPGGSVKDRAALQMIRDAERDGRLTPARAIIDSTSGNTGVAYAMIGAALGYRVKLVMPENVTIARKRIIAAYGAEIVYSSPMEGSDGAILLVRELVEKSPDAYFYPDQYSNAGNPKAHYLGTGPEILDAVGDRITHFLAGIGTSGTVVGTGRRLKEHRKDIQVIAVEPDDALHGLEGLKHMASSLVPAIWRPEEMDRILPMPTEEAWDTSERLAHEEGIFVGHSGGAAMAAALRVAREIGEGCIVTIFPDRGDRYFQPMKWEKHHER
ncbi:MAG: cysteine synthase family protein [Myxococcota bacterium]